MFCEQCGGSVSARAAFCGHCGADLRVAGAMPSSAPAPEPAATSLPPSPAAPSQPGPRPSPDGEWTPSIDVASLASRLDLPGAALVVGVAFAVPTAAALLWYLVAVLSTPADGSGYGLLATIVAVLALTFGADVMTRGAIEGPDATVGTSFLLATVTLATMVAVGVVLRRRLANRPPRTAAEALAAAGVPTALTMAAMLVVSLVVRPTVTGGFSLPASSTSELAVDWEVKVWASAPSMLLHVALIMAVATGLAVAASMRSSQPAVGRAWDMVELPARVTLVPVLAAIVASTVEELVTLFRVADYVLGETWGWLVLLALVLVYVLLAPQIMAVFLALGSMGLVSSTSYGSTSSVSIIDAADREPYQWFFVPLVLGAFLLAAWMLVRRRSDPSVALRDLAVWCGMLALLGVVSVTMLGTSSFTVGGGSGSSSRTGASFVVIFLWPFLGALAWAAVAGATGLFARIPRPTTASAMARASNVVGPSVAQATAPPGTTPAPVDESGPFGDLPSDVPSASEAQAQGPPPGVSQEEWDSYVAGLRRYEQEMLLFRRQSGEQDPRV